MSFLVLIFTCDAAARLADSQYLEYGLSDINKPFEAKNFNRWYYSPWFIENDITYFRFKNNDFGDYLFTVLERYNIARGFHFQKNQSAGFGHRVSYLMLPIIQNFCNLSVTNVCVSNPNKSSRLQSWLRLLFLTKINLCCIICWK